MPRPPSPWSNGARLPTNPVGDGGLCGPTSRLCERPSGHGRCMNRLFHETRPNPCVGADPAGSDRGSCDVGIGRGVERESGEDEVVDAALHATTGDREPDGDRHRDPDPSPREPVRDRRAAHDATVSCSVSAGVCHRRPPRCPRYMPDSARFAAHRHEHRTDRRVAGPTRDRVETPRRTRRRVRDPPYGDPTNQDAPYRAITKRSALPGGCDGGDVPVIRTAAAADDVEVRQLVA